MSSSRTSLLTFVAAIVALALAPLATGALNTGGALSGGSAPTMGAVAALVRPDGRSPDTSDAAALAQATGAALSTPGGDPLAVGYLTGRGLSPSEVTSWTVGACSHATKAASCYTMLQSPAAPVRVDPLAVSYLTGKGLSPNEVTSWTAGACSQATRAVSCYTMLDRASGATVATSASRSVGFRWGDAGIGAAGGLVIAFAIGGAILVVSRSGGRRIAS